MKLTYINWRTQGQLDTHSHTHEELNQAMLRLGHITMLTPFYTQLHKLPQNIIIHTFYFLCYSFFIHTTWYYNTSKYNKYWHIEKPWIQKDIYTLYTQVNGGWRVIKIILNAIKFSGQKMLGKKEWSIYEFQLTGVGGFTLIHQVHQPHQLVLSNLFSWWSWPQLWFQLWSCCTP